MKWIGGTGRNRVNVEEKIAKRNAITIYVVLDLFWGKG